MNRRGKLRDRGTIRSRIRGSEIYPGLAVVIDGLTSSHEQREVATNFELVTHRRELPPHFSGHAIPKEDLAADIKVAAHCEAGCLYRGLQVHAVIDDVGHELRVGERLVASTHDTDARQPSLASRGQRNALPFRTSSVCNCRCTAS